MLCARFVVRTVTKYIEKRNVKSSCVCLPEYLPPTPPGDASAITPLLLCVTGDAAEEQVTWSTVRVGQAAGLSAFASAAFMSGDLWLHASLCLMCMVYHQGKSAFLTGAVLSHSLHQASLVWEFNRLLVSTGSRVLLALLPIQCCSSAEEYFSISPLLIWGEGMGCGAPPLQPSVITVLSMNS